MAQVILVNEYDIEIGLEEKVTAHLGEGLLHRAFTTLVFNNKGDTLIAQRSANKMLWPLVWDSACASHPTQNESYINAAENRLFEELGFTCKLKIVDSFQYKAKYKEIGSENEICAILFGIYNGDVFPVPEEVADYKWISIMDLEIDIDKNPEKYAIWLMCVFRRIRTVKPEISGRHSGNIRTPCQ